MTNKLLKEKKGKQNKFDRNAANIINNPMRKSIQDIHSITTNDVKAKYLLKKNKKKSTNQRNNETNQKCLSID